MPSMCAQLSGVRKKWRWRHRGRCWVEETWENPDQMASVILQCEAGLPHQSAEFGDPGNHLRRMVQPGKCEQKEEGWSLLEAGNSSPGPFTTLTEKGKMKRKSGRSDDQQ